MPRSITPAVPRKSCQYDFLVLASDTLKSSPTAFVYPYGAESLEGGTSPLRPAMFPVYASCGSFDGMPILPNHATLGTGCWPGFARQRLALYKKHQAALGALTLKLSGGLAQPRHPLQRYVRLLYFWLQQFS